MREGRHALWITVATFAVIASGMAYSFWWATIVYNHQYWTMPGDIWSTVGVAHLIGSGHPAHIYSYGSLLETLPGFEVVFAPVVMLSSWLHLGVHIPYARFQSPEPSSWLLIGPAMLAVAWVGLWVFDQLARRLVSGGGLRRAVTVVVAVAMWPTLAIWGHPEDVVAIALALLAILKAVDRRYTAAGWLLGAAITMQLMVLLLVPLLIGIVGTRKAPAVLARAAVLPGFLLVVVLAHDFQHAVKVLVDQPAYPAAGHPTPWLTMAPKLGGSGHLSEFAGGPSRVGAVVVAAVAGVLASRRRDDLASIAWLVVVVFAARCLFESLMEPYYVMPVVATVIVVGAARGRALWLVTVGAGLGLTCQAFLQQGAWSYYSEMTALLLVVLAASMPASAWTKRTVIHDNEAAIGFHGQDAGRQFLPSP